MASKTITDLGASVAGYRIGRDGTSPVVQVEIVTDGGSFVETLRPADIAAVTTAQERTAFQATLGKLYAAALVKAGFAG